MNMVKKDAVINRGEISRGTERDMIPSCSTSRILCSGLVSELWQRLL
jgi:hypothetical protein